MPYRAMLFVIIQGFFYSMGPVSMYAGETLTAETDIDVFFEDLFWVYAARDPQESSQFGLKESVQIQGYKARLTDVSVTALIQNFQRKKECLQRLNSYAVEGLSDNQKLSCRIFGWKLQHEITGQKFLLHNYEINQMNGILISLTALMTQFHTLESIVDVENYISRLNKIPTQIQQAVEFLQLQHDNGITLPRFAIEKVIRMMVKSMPENVKDHVFYRYFVRNVERMDISNKEALADTVKNILRGTVYPAYFLLEAYFTQLLSTTHTQNGVWALPDGDEYYAYMLKHHTTTNLSADEIHALGLQEVAGIQKEMRAILAGENIVGSNKTIGDLMQEFSTKSQWYYPDTQAGRDQCIADYGKILDRSRKELAHLFDLTPTIPLTIQPVPLHEQEGRAAAYYRRPSLDGSRPGTFFINLRNMAEIPQYGMETLTIHEAEPGHHFQLALQAEMDIPMLRKIGIYAAHAEGWALYTEKLAYEQGFYSSPYAKLGHLQDELLRAVRLVIDTGIHHKRWTREQAIAYMEQELGYHHDSVVTEVERYFVLPGQACAYKIGQLKILELRERAKKALGTKFNIRDFHNVILKTAAVPLAILEEQIDHYIREKVGVSE